MIKKKLCSLVSLGMAGGDGVMGLVSFGERRVAGIISLTLETDISNLGDETGFINRVQGNRGALGESESAVKEDRGRKRGVRPGR